MRIKKYIKPVEEGGREETGEGGFDFGDELTSDSWPLSSCCLPILNIF